MAPIFFLIGAALRQSGVLDSSCAALNRRFPTSGQIDPIAKQITMFHRIEK